MDDCFNLVIWWLPSKQWCKSFTLYCPQNCQIPEWNVIYVATFYHEHSVVAILYHYLKTFIYFSSHYLNFQWSFSVFISLYRPTFVYVLGQEWLVSYTYANVVFLLVSCIHSSYFQSWTTLIVDQKVSQLLLVVAPAFLAFI